MNVPASISIFTVGMLLGWPAPTLKLLRQADSPLHLTPSEEALIVNALFFGTFLAPFPCGALMDRVGRKTSMLTLALFPILSWALVHFAQGSFSLVIARCLAGICVGGWQTLVPVYVAEIAEPQVRGIAGCFFMVRPWIKVSWKSRRKRVCVGDIRRKGQLIGCRAFSSFTTARLGLRYK